MKDTAILPKIKHLITAKTMLSMLSTFEDCMCYLLLFVLRNTPKKKRIDEITASHLNYYIHTTAWGNSGAVEMN